SHHSLVLFSLLYSHPSHRDLLSFPTRRSSDLTTSTSCITGTGFMKCIPITCVGRRVAAAMAVIEIDDVLLARMARPGARASSSRSEEHTSELQSPDHLVCRLLLEKKKRIDSK